MKVNIVVITLSTGGSPSQFAVPFSSIHEAKKFASKVLAYWRKHTNFMVKVTVQNSMPVREKVGKDWRKAGINL